MKYVEELRPGDIFSDEKNKSFLKTSDFRKSEKVKYLCVSIDTGIGSWIEGSTIVKILDLYRRDEDGNILPIKVYTDPKEEFSKT